MFEPELFPALRILTYNHICVNVFATGKVVLFGLRSMDYDNFVQIVVENILLLSYKERSLGLTKTLICDFFIYIEEGTPFIKIINLICKSHKLRGKINKLIFPKKFKKYLNMNVNNFFSVAYKYLWQK